MVSPLVSCKSWSIKAKIITESSWLSIAASTTYSSIWCNTTFNLALDLVQQRAPILLAYSWPDICRVTMGSLQSAILGFGIFKVLEGRCGVKGLSLAENVIIQTTAVATATMPLSAGRHIPDCSNPILPFTRSTVFSTLPAVELWGHVRYILRLLTNQIQTKIYEVLTTSQWSMQLSPKMHLAIAENGSAVA